MTGSIVLIAGSPAVESRSSFVLDAFGQALTARGFSIERYSLTSFALEDLVRGRAESESVARFLKSVAGARGVVFSTPVYKATYAGVLKLIIDLLAPPALEGKAALAITTARLEPHLAEVDESFQRLYRFFRGSVGLHSLGLLDTQLGTPAALDLDESAQRALDDAIAKFSAASS
jgi:FMN reductase